jgi:tetratricopeptide (TPR) repeat protein
MTFSICLNMIVKDESHIIEETLTKLLEKIHIDYWVICDTGSSDNTIDLIQNFFKLRNIPGQLHCDQWKDFAHNRTLALEYAFNKTDYLLIFDADDTIHGDLELPAQLTADAYYFNFGSTIKYVRPLLINNHKKWKFESVIHEYLVECEPNMKYENLQGNYYVESGRVGSRNKDPEKYLKDAQILEKAFYEAEKENKSIKNRYAFYAGNSYFDFGNQEKALEWYKKVLTLGNWNQEKYVSSYKIAAIYKKLNKPEKQIYYLIQTFEYDNKRVEGIYNVILHYIMLEQYAMAFQYYKFIEKYYETEYRNDASLKNKLFIEQNTYLFSLPYIMILVAEKVQDFTLQLKMFCMIFLQEYIPPVASLPINVFDQFETTAKKLSIPDNIMQLYYKYQTIVYKVFPKQIQTNTNSKKILFFTGNCPLQWNKSYSLTQGLGGSERAVIYLSECFPTDYEIFITGNVAQEQINNVTYIPYNELSNWLHQNTCHTVIVSRYLYFFESFSHAKTSNIIIWAHDTDLLNYGSSLTSAQLLQKYDSKINHFVFLTNWHQQLMIARYPWIKSKSIIINNGIVDIPDYKVNKIPNSFVYTSCSERGLKRLLVLWPEILKLLPGATLRISSYNPFPKDDAEKELELILSKYPSINHVGTCSPTQLYKLLQYSEYWLYPSYWPETSCITSMEMLRCGVICLYYPIAGLPETIGSIGLEIKEGNEIQMLASLTPQGKQELMQKGKEYTSTCLWKNRFELWSQLFNFRKKVISFSLWGDKKIYMVGALKNVKLAQELYPGFECWFYIHKETVPQEVINELQLQDSVKIIYKTGDLKTVKPMMWRFEAIDDPNIDILLSRDSDSRLCVREKIAVDKWLESNKNFHIMRDHPYHTVPILGGMFGCKKLNFIWRPLMEKIQQDKSKGYDQDFLASEIYPLVKDDALIHANFYKIESCCQNFPTDYDEEFHFVGEVFDEYDARDEQVIKILKDNY